MITKLTNSSSMRFAGELLKDINSLITKVEKLNKTLKKIQIDPSSIDMSGFKTLQNAMKTIESAEQEVNTWAVRFGVAEEKIKKGAKRKAPAATYYAVRPSVKPRRQLSVRMEAHPIILKKFTKRMPCTHWPRSAIYVASSSFFVQSRI